ncbi:MAG: hypothetical protein KAG66_05120, partial [Methylococcales bacterium]|nr:hypothetical protein [Methylococcales bacterium]
MLRYRHFNTIACKVILISGSLLFGACGSSDNTEAPDTDPLDDGASATPPTAPFELTGVVYTETEIEIFWDHAQDDVVVMGYDVSRNGELLVSVLDARSYFENTVAPATDYTYTVTAVDNEGTRGPPANFMLSTPERLPVLRQSNYFLVIAQVFEFFTQAAYDGRILNASPESLQQPGRRYQFDFDNTGYAGYTEYDCENDGLLTLRYTDISCSGRCRSSTSMYYQCGLLVGVATGRKDFNSTYSSTSTNYVEMSVTLSNGRSLVLNGELAYQQIGGK